VAGGAGRGGEGGAAAARRDKSVNALPASISSAGCTRRLQPSRVIHLGALEVAVVVVDSGWRRGVTRERWRGRVGVRRQRERGKSGWEQSYPTTELLRRLAERKKRWSGGATGGRSSAMVGGRGARCARVSRAKGGSCSLGRGARVRGHLNRGGQAPRRAGPRPRAARNGTVRRPDSDSSLSRARGGRRPQQVGLAR
jgi:hypothetical protein